MNKKILAVLLISVLVLGTVLTVDARHARRQGSDISVIHHTIDSEFECLDCHYSFQIDLSDCGSCHRLLKGQNGRAS